MGNKCCSDDSQKSAQFSPSKTIQKNQQVVDIHNQISYIDSEGQPLPNAYKRYVKPPTTVGRQSLIVRDLHQNDEVPDWIWALDNNILNSNHKKPNIDFSPNLKNRNTFQEIKGRYQGVQTINLSKLHYQQNLMTASTKPAGFNTQIAPNSITRTLQPRPVLPFLEQSSKPIQYSPIGNSPFPQNSTIKRTFSISDQPINNPINLNEGGVQNRFIPSNLVSVNNSFHQSPSRQFSVIRY